MSSTDRIEKNVLLRAPRSRVWKALTDHREFGEWFGVDLREPFAVGATVRGQIRSRGYEHVTMQIAIDRIDPETAFAYRWHPYAVEPGVDYSSEKPTLVEFRLADEAGGTRLSVVESGFDAVPAARRAEAFRMNSQGWGAQLENVTKYLDAAR